MERIERELKCPKCLHEWTSRKFEPKECPHCKKRLDWSKHTYCVDPREGFVIPMPEVSSDKGDGECDFMFSNVGLG